MRRQHERYVTARSRRRVDSELLTATSRSETPTRDATPYSLLVETDYHAIVKAWLRGKYGAERIPDNGTKATLDRFVAIAGLLRAHGLDGAGIQAELNRVNAELAERPLKPAKFKTMGKWAERKYSAGHLDDEDHHKARRLVRELRELAAAVPWPGVAGLTDRKALVTILELCRGKGETVFNMACRDLAKLICCNKDTAGATLARLCEAGWLVRLAKSYGLRPHLYGLTRPENLLSQRSDSQGTSCSEENLLNVRTLRNGTTGAGNEPAVVTGSSVGRTHSSADQWSWSKMGPAAQRVSEIVSGLAEPETPQKIAAAAGVHLATCYRALARLHVAELASEDHGQWSPGKALVETYTRLDERRAIYRAERVLHHRDMAERGHTDKKIPTPTLTAAELAIVRRKAPTVAKRLAAAGLVPDEPRVRLVVKPVTPAPAVDDHQPKPTTRGNWDPQLTVEEIARRKAELRAQLARLQAEGKVVQQPDGAWVSTAAVQR